MDELGGNKWLRKQVIDDLHQVLLFNHLRNVPMTIDVFNDLDLPDTMETVEDYDKICQNFVLPFLHKQASEIAEVIVELHQALDKGKVEQEQVDDYINRVKELAGFATEGNPMFAYFEQVLDLEQRLDSQGLLTDE